MKRAYARVNAINAEPTMMVTNILLLDARKLEAFVMKKATPKFMQNSPSLKLEHWRRQL
jgi:hypothetical protein